ncbi:MAG TPA: hypothetical protein VER04_22940 [Polyangiaceae bacterium]|nr:hypothetical protein [Polyangiaceae bacterium]
MRSPSEPCSDTDAVPTVPAPKQVNDSGSPMPGDWDDNEAPTPVYSERPLFARPPRLPST